MRGDHVHPVYRAPLCKSLDLVCEEHDRCLGTLREKVRSKPGPTFGSGKNQESGICPDCNSTTCHIARLTGTFPGNRDHGFTIMVNPGTLSLEPIWAVADLDDPRSLCEQETTLCYG